MRKINRGQEPQELTDARTVELLEARKHFVDELQSDGFKFSAYKTVRRALHSLTGGHCAYCEAYYDVTEPGDLEHFRPKGAIETSNGRVTPGYWWLAAVWENLLPSCIRCNREETQALYDGTSMKVGKGERFPIFDEADRASAENGEANERPLLINPTEDEPADHIKFVEEEGYCVAKCVDETETTENGRRARASIDIYGLNRSGLVTDRSRQMLRANASLRQLELGMAELDRLIALGQPTEFVEMTIAREVELLGSLTSGNDRFTGVIRGLVYPVMRRLGVYP
ncbi:hypothetical protein DXT91_10410 [Agrobacterium tumefaciens]|uniref:hypothetical protein n=1 Tax=Agrobacterium tumefaciens TaxID=358 RepID=UPI0012B754F9|nr:hypothetical protein [Agrobacterium tumefaciens]MQB04541.1 hypothetical protein [Agrobacterium tumefaciens]